MTNGNIEKAFELGQTMEQINSVICAEISMLKGSASDEFKREAIARQVEKHKPSLEKLSFLVNSRYKKIKIVTKAVNYTLQNYSRLEEAARPYLP